MTREDKQLLLKDLCARLPYGVIVKYKSREGEGDVQLGCGNIGYVSQLGNGWWKECKPYLRPMSSMTEEEVKEFYDVERMGHPVGYIKPQCDWHFTIKGIDWLNAHHFDYRGLIEKGLSIEASEGMYLY
jgi:hypothetical protein